LDKEGNKTGGRQPGSLNKLTRSFNELLHITIDEMESDPKTAFLTWAYANQTEFWKIAAKLIPIKVDASMERKVITVIRKQNGSGIEQPSPGADNDSERSEEVQCP
jgi:hypothetical protein